MQRYGQTTGWVVLSTLLMATGTAESQTEAASKANTHARSEYNRVNKAILKTSPEDSARIMSSVIIADEDVVINGASYTEGDIHSNNDIVYRSAADAIHIGNMTARDDIRIKGDLIISGDVKAADRLKFDKNVIIEGAYGQEEVEAFEMISPEYTTGEHDLLSQVNHIIILTPGKYGIVEVGEGSTAYLSSGDYFMKEFDTDNFSKIIIDVSDGPVNIHVTDKLDLDGDVTMEIVPSGQAGSHMVTMTTVQDRKMWVAKNSLIFGTIIAPNATVSVLDGARFKGSIIARVVETRRDAMLISHSSEKVLEQVSTGKAAGRGDITVAGPAGDYELHQNYPNPFNGNTFISFSATEETRGRLAIYDMAGTLIKELFNGNIVAGTHQYLWNGRDAGGKAVATGTYFYRIETPTFIAKKKLLMIK